MAKININNKNETKERIVLQNCEYGAIVRINGEIFITTDYCFDETELYELSVTSLEDGSICFFHKDTPCEVYYGAINLNEEDFKKFED